MAGRHLYRKTVKGHCMPSTYDMLGRDLYADQLDFSGPVGSSIDYPMS